MRQYLSIGGELQGIGDIFGTKVFQFHCGWNGFRQLAQRQAVRGGEAQPVDGQVVTVYFFNLDVLQIESWQVECLYGKGIVVVFFHFKDKAIVYITALREFFFRVIESVKIKGVVFGFAHLDSIAASLLVHANVKASLIGVGETVDAFFNVEARRYQGDMILLGRPFALAQRPFVFVRIGNPGRPVVVAVHFIGEIADVGEVKRFGIGRMRIIPIVSCVHFGNSSRF